MILAHVEAVRSISSVVVNRVAFSKTADTSNKSGGQFLDEYMENRGFYFVPEEQMGGILVYSNGNEKIRIIKNIIKNVDKYGKI